MENNKNIWLLPTDKPTRLHIKNGLLGGQTTQFYIEYFIGNKHNSLNIYITSDEEIKEGDWYLDTTINVVFKNDKIFLNGVGYKKIILTDNKDLIKDGVQAIDDEFLEWFVKNPSCEEVEVEYGDDGNGYQIIIPSEEPKQETLEEAAKGYAEANKFISDRPFEFARDKNAFIAGAECQAERMYSEEDMREAYKYGKIWDATSFEEWFEQFKKK